MNASTTPGRCRFALRCGPVPALSVLLVLAGCVSGPEHLAPQAVVPSAWRTQAVGVAPVSDPSRHAWWQALGDPALNSLIEQAIRLNADLRLAALRVEQAAARVQVAASERWPTVTVAGQSVREKLSSERHVPIGRNTPLSSAAYEANAAVSWELDLWGRVRRQNEAAEADWQASDEERKALGLSVVAQVAETYVRLLAADRERALLQRLVANREQALDWHLRKQRDGGASALPALTARTDVEAVRAMVPPKEREIAALENALSLLVGQNPAAMTRGQDLLTLRPLDVPAGLPSDLLRQRPDIRMAERQLAAASARIGVAQAAFLPRIALTSVAGFASTDLSRLLSSEAFFGHLGTQLGLTAFDAGRRDAEVRDAEIFRDQRVVAYGKVVRGALVEVEDALVHHQKSVERDAFLAQRSRTLAELLDLTRRRVEGGYASAIDVIRAETQLIQAELDRVEAQRDVHQSLLHLHKALGGGWALTVPAPPVAASAAVADSTLTQTSQGSGSGHE